MPADRLARQVAVAVAVASWTTLSGALLVSGLALGAAAGPSWPDAAGALLLLAAAGLLLSPGGDRRRLLGAGLAAAAVALALLLGPGMWPSQESSPGQVVMVVARDLQLVYAAVAAIVLAAARVPASLAGWHPAAAGVWLLVAALLLGGCGAGEPDQVLGGATVKADRLARGRALYDRYCAICHGERGDGLGPSAAFLWPPPRDFRPAQFKFTAAGEGALPDDAELARVIRQGLAGTAMQPWDLPDSELGPIIDHLKTFSPPGRGFRDPDRRPALPPIAADPWRDPAEALAAGARGYHADLQCSQCHPAYALPDQMAAWQAAPRPTDAGEPVPKWSATYRSVLLPPDFLRHPMRWVRLRPGAALDHDPADLYRIIAHGMNGPMPGYGHLPAEQVWAVVHYTKWLADQRDSERGRALRRRLDAAW
jgi:mono/diheme cytochrome c family protein